METACRRSSRVEEANCQIEIRIDRLRRIFRRFETIDVSNWKDLFPSFLQCEKEASDLISAIRRISSRVHVGNVRREEIESELDGFERRQLYVCRREIINITGLISKIGWYVPPAHVGHDAPACLICQEDTAFGSSGRVLLRHCGSRRSRHSMCARCFIAWFIEEGNSTCPFCRTDFEEHFN